MLNVDISRAQERGSHTSPGQHSRAGPGVVAVGELVLRAGKQESRSASCLFLHRVY